ncbi:hypothetical protein [Staphylococcus casei]|uniref:Lipoprotein n=1 Tax=Staphylococcus casei TaxID=201828 RepID=A0ABZ2WAY0_9STAP
MKTTLLLTGVLSASLLLGACGNDDSKSDSKDKKSESVEKKKETPKKSESKKDTDKKETEEAKATQEPATNEPNTQESVEQPVTQEEPAPVEQQEATVQQQVEPTEQEKAEANAKVAKENGYTGIPNGDAMFDTPVGHAPVPEKYKDQEVDNSVETEAEVAEAEKETLREKYNGGLSSGEMQTKTAIEQGYYDGDDADEVMEKIEKSEQEIADGKYDQYK